MKVWEGLEYLNSIEQMIKAQVIKESLTDLQLLARCLGNTEAALKCLRGQ